MGRMAPSARPSLRALALAALGLLPQTAVGALLARARSQPREGPSAGKALRLDLGEAPARIELENYLDLQYIARIRVGEPVQEITSIIDTGSFDLVVFEHACKGCGQAGVYDRRKSRSHSYGRLVTQLSYGSGEVIGDEAFDRVAVGNSWPAEQRFWQISRAEMPLLAHARFQSILGVGPPESPAGDAWNQTASDLRALTEFMRQEAGEQIPPKKMVRDIESDLVSAMDITSRSPILWTFGVRSFSICLGRKPGSNGYFIWNDTLAQELPSAFTHLRVVGKHSWTVLVTEVRLDYRVPGPEGISPPLGGCRGGCGAVIDSGTSLLVAPPQAVEAMEEAVRAVNHNCDGLADLPSLVLTIDGNEFTLPPDAYAYRSWVSTTCRLQNSASASSATTAVGAMWILGMPFLRRYYTTFHLGQDLNSRMLLVAPSNGDCSPGVKKGFSLSAQREKPYLRTYNPEAAYITPMAHKAVTESFVRI